MSSADDELEIPGAADLEAVIAEHGDEPDRDDLIRWMVSKGSVLALGDPLSEATAYFLHCEVAFDGELLPMVPVFTRLGYIARALEVNPTWESFNVLQVAGATALEDLGFGEWLVINPWSGREFKLPGPWNAG